MINPFRQLADGLEDRAAALYELAHRALEDCRHGDLPRWVNALDSLPPARAVLDADRAAPWLGESADALEELSQSLMQLHPWRKGPLVLGGVEIDTEWRSDWKWERISPHVDLVGHTVLDVGCGNGYFGWRMLAAGARRVIGIDPTWVFVMQWLACRHFAGDALNHVLPLGIEQVPDRCGGFDSVFSMGVLYHRRDPHEHLRRLASLTRGDGQVVIETLVIDTPDDSVLTPQGRYARMRNVHAVPSTGRLQRWAEESGLLNARIVDVTPTTTEEQRSTRWMTFESLDRCLDPQDPTRTVEGYPAPVRAILTAVAP